MAARISGALSDEDSSLRAEVPRQDGSKRNIRVDARMAPYQHSELVRYLEEALAESYAQVKVTGISGLPTGIRFPVANGYVRLDRVVKESAVGTLAVGGLTYGVYVVTESAGEDE